MKRAFLCALVVFMLWVSYSMIAWAAGSYGVSGTRTYKLYNPAEFNTVTGYTKQSGEIQQVKTWWKGTTDVYDTLCDTIYTKWVNIGSQPGLELYSMRYIVRVLAVDSIGSWDSADTYTPALQTCLNPFTSDSTLITTVHSFAALTDTGTKAWYCPAESVSAYTYWTSYARSRIIVRAVIDTSAWWVPGFYTQSTYIPIQYEAHYKPIWR